MNAQLTNMDTQTALGIAQQNALPTMPKGQDMQKMREAAQEFEAVFLSQMLKPMFEGIGSAPPFGGGPAEEMYRSLMMDEYGKSIAKAGGIGIADQVLREMIKLQEVQ